MNVATPLTAALVNVPLKVTPAGLPVSASKTFAVLPVRLPFVSRICTVTTEMVCPAAVSVGCCAKASLAAAPAITLNVIGFPAPAARAPVDAVPEAVMVTEPARLPVTVNVATPATALLEPSPVTVPVPEVLANVILIVLSAPVLTVLPPVS